MIKLTKYTKKDGPEDTVTEHELATVAAFAGLLDESSDSLMIRVGTDAEFYGVMSAVRRFNDPIGERALASAEPGAIVDSAKMWQCKMQLNDSGGWRMNFALEPTRLKKPLESPPKMELVTDPKIIEKLQRGERP
jgi:hypothetical protein